MSEDDRLHWDVIVIGGGPAAATIGSLLARDGYSVILLERDIHPRDHVGESLTPSTNLIFERMGFQEKMEDAGFVHKPGAAWTSPRAPLGTFFSIRLAEFPMPGAKQPYTYNIERDEFDTLLLRHAHDQGAKVLQGVNVQRVLFDGQRAVGVRARVVEGWEQDLFAKVVVDASFERNLLKGTITTIMVEEIGFSFEPPRATLDKDAFKSAELVAAKLWKMIQIQVRITGYE